MGLIYCGGRAIEIDATVETWKARPELGFPRLKMRRETRAVVWHWTGGVGLAKQVHATLVARRCSVHFLIEPDGKIFQFADAETRAAHANDPHEMPANGWAIGVEMVNPATPKQSGKVARELVVETIHGRDSVATTFTAAQVKAALVLAEALEDAYDLPPDVPMNGSDVATTVGTLEEIAEFRGHLPHFWLKLTKRDCGLVLMRALAARPLRGREGAAE